MAMSSYDDLLQEYSGVFLDDGLGAEVRERYRERRRRLMSRAGHPVLIRGIDEGPGGANVWPVLYEVVYQEPAMLYLTGVNQLKTALFLDPETGDEILFVGKKDPHLEFWEGTRFGVGNPESEAVMRELTGVAQVKDIVQLFDFLAARFSGNRSPLSLGLLWHESKDQGKLAKDSNYVFKEELLRWLVTSGFSHISVGNIAPLLWEERAIPDEADIRNLKEAVRITGTAFRDILPFISNMGNEGEVTAALNGAIRRQSYFGNSFPSIVAGGKNGTVLHYNKNNDPLNKDDLLLLDFGAKWYGMNADISRTVPVSGTFNPLQRLLYDIVLSAQSKVEQEVKAGVTIQHLNMLCWEFVTAEIDRNILKKGGVAKFPYDKAPHNVSHLLGLQVHDGDPFRNYRTEPLREGMVITNEPGVYGYFELMAEGRLWAGHVGIRIEDDLLVTAGGCVNLAQEIPKKADEIERLMQGKQAFVKES